MVVPCCCEVWGETRKMSNGNICRRDGEFGNLSGETLAFMRLVLVQTEQCQFSEPGMMYRA